MWQPQVLWLLLFAVLKASYMTSTYDVYGGGVPRHIPLWRRGRWPWPRHGCGCSHSVWRCLAAMVQAGREAPNGRPFWGGGVSNPDSAIPSPAFTFMLLAPGWAPVFPGCRQSCDGAQALIRQQVFKRAQTHLPEGELNDLAFGHVSVCPQLQHRGLRGLLQDLASPKRLPAKTLFTRGVHVELVQTAGFEPATSPPERALVPR